MNLLPLNINMLVEKNMTEELEKFNINDCIECGCCSYVCPAKRHLVQSMRLGKSRLKARRTTQKTG
jgi:electron transport complex protein RnfC